MTTITIILPHKRNPGNNEALSLCLDMLQTNTVSDFVLIMAADNSGQIYPAVNAMVRQAQTEVCVYWASDMFAAPGWDLPMLQLFEMDTFINNTVVEPGVISMYGGNHKEDFGRTPETFNRPAFEAWAVNGHTAGGDGWFAPYMFPRSGFIEMGGLDTTIDADLEFGSADMALFDKWKETGNRVIRAPGSFVYHLQRWSDVHEQEAEKRK